MFVFVKTAKPSSRVTVLAAVPPAIHESSCAPHPHQDLVRYCHQNVVSILAIPISMRQHVIIILIFIHLIAYYVTHPFVCLLAIYVFFGETTVFDLFLDWFFSYRWVLRVLYAFWVIDLNQMCLLPIFLPVCGFLLSCYCLWEQTF